MRRTGSTLMLCAMGIGVGISYSRMVALSAATERFACLICSSVGGSESGLRYGESGPKYFPSASVRAINFSWVAFGFCLGSITTGYLPRVIVGRKSCHSLAVLPLLTVKCCMEWQL